MMAVTPSSTVRIRSGGMQRAIHWGLQNTIIVNEVYNFTDASHGLSTKSQSKLVCKMTNQILWTRVPSSDVTRV